LIDCAKFHENSPYAHAYFITDRSVASQTRFQQVDKTILSHYDQIRLLQWFG